VAERPEDSTFNFSLNICCYVLAFGGAILSTYISVSRSNDNSPATTIGGRFGGFTAGVLIIGAIPYLVSLIIPRSFRLLFRAIGMLCTASFLFYGLAVKGNPESQANYDLRVVNQDMDKLSKAEHEAQAIAGNFDPKTIQSSQDISTRRAAITKVRDARSDEVTYFENFDKHCRDALAKDQFNPEMVAKTIATTSQTAHIDYVLTRCRIKVKISDDMISILNFLNKNWGEWSAKDGKMIFEDEASVTNYKALAKSLNDDITEANDLKNPFDPPITSSKQSN
jgi:hypothetical protein